MNTAKQIVDFLKAPETSLTGSADADRATAMLLTRCDALRGTPAEHIEGLLAWATNGVASAARALREARGADIERADETLARAKRRDLTSSLHGFGWSGSKVDVCRVRLEDAVETFNRVLAVYEATAKD